MSHGDIGKIMAHGELESMKDLNEFSEMVPKPIGSGTFESDSGIHFYLGEFVDLIDEVPDIVDFCKGVAELHRKSLGHSPDSKFGFRVPTCNGTVRRYTTWTSSWEAFHIEALKLLFEQEEQVHGPCEEFQEMMPALFEKVVPRLLRPLETEGRTLQPALCHGDLWDGNVSVDFKNGQPYAFDPSAFWGHNEYDLYMWRGERYKFSRAFRKEYHTHFPVSPPEDDWDDRNLLYTLSADLHDSVLFTNSKNFRHLTIETMKDLIKRYPNGYEGKASQKGTETVTVDAVDDPNEESRKVSKLREVQDVEAGANQESNGTDVEQILPESEPKLHDKLRDAQDRGDEAALN